MLLAELLPNMHRSYLEDKAEYILKQNNVKYPQDINLEQIIQNYKNIKVFYMKQDSKTIIKKNKIIIIVNNTLSYREQRQELAEEFCHALLHLGNQINYFNTINLDKQEQQAKRMAAYLLCPTYIFKNISVPYDTYVLVDELADIFNVTTEFMQYRLKLIWGQDLDMIICSKGKFYGYMPIE